MGDAQIDAQNRATSDIGVIKNQYNAVKASGGLTRNFIQSTTQQIQQVINDYNALWGNTSRGAAGGQTLQAFFDSKMMPEFNNDLQSLPLDTTSTGLTPPPTTDVNATPMLVPYGGTPATTNIVIGGTPSSQTSANIQPSQSPGPPPGITVAPDVAPAPWYMNPAVLLLAGVVLLPMLIGKSSNR
jgi:hypothetical protein